MPATGNTLSASFGVDLSPLKRDFAEAKSIARTGAASVTAELKKAGTAAPGAAVGSPVDWERLGRERAQRFAQSVRGYRTAADFLPAPPGKYPAPEEDEGETAAGRHGRRLFHLVRGIAITEIFRRAIHTITEAILKADEFREKLAKLPSTVPSGAFRSIGEMEESLRASSALLDEIRAKRTYDESSLLRRGVGAVRKFFTGESDVEDQANKDRLRGQASEEINQMAVNQRFLNEAEREGISGSEEKAALLKEEATHRQRIYQLAAAEAAAHVDNSAARNEENARTELVNQQIAKRFQLKRLEEETENRILNLQASSLGKDQQSTVALQERLKTLKEELALLSTIEAKTAKGTEIHRVENQLTQAQYAESQKTPQQQAAEFYAQQAYRNFVQRQTPSPGAYLSSPEAYGRRDILGREIDAAGNVIGPGGPIMPPDYRTPEFSSQLGDLTEHMEPYQGSDWFKKAFHPEEVQQPDQGVEKPEEERPLTKDDLVDAFETVMEKYWS